MLCAPYPIPFSMAATGHWFLGALKGPTGWRTTKLEGVLQSPTDTGKGQEHKEVKELEVAY